MQIDLDCTELTDLLVLLRRRLLELAVKPIVPDPMGVHAAFRDRLAALADKIETHRDATYHD